MAICFERNGSKTQTGNLYIGTIYTIIRSFARQSDIRQKFVGAGRRGPARRGVRLVNRAIDAFHAVKDELAAGEGHGDVAISGGGSFEGEVPCRDGRMFKESKSGEREFG